MINEGIFLQEKGIDPYSGRLVHSMPFNIMLESFFTSDLFKCLFFALLDSLTGVILAYGSKNYLIWKVSLLNLYYLNWALTPFQNREDQEIRKQFSNTVFDNLDIISKDLILIPKCVLLFYSLNPILILTSTNTNILCNLFYALAFYSVNSRKTTLSLLAITFLFLDSLYAIVLLSPILVAMSGDTFKKVQKSLLLVVFIALFMLINYSVFGSWSFIEGTMGFS